MTPKLAFIRNHSETAYRAMTKKILSWTKSFELMRMVLLISWFTVNMFVYLYFVNLSSTAGYFYGEAQQEKDSIEFVYNITKLRIVELHSVLWNTLQETTNMKTVDVNKDLVTLFID